jgi:hypothetical protein
MGARNPPPANAFAVKANNIETNIFFIYWNIIDAYSTKLKPNGE